MKSVFYFIIFFSTIIQANAQNIPVGTWQSYFSYNTANSVAINNQMVYSGKYGLQCFNQATTEYTQYTKVNGLADVNIIKLGFSKNTSSLIIAYETSNLDILQDGKFYNIPDLKNANIVASKKVNNIVCNNNEAYLSTGLGIVVINLIKKEIKATYPMQIDGAQSTVFDIIIHQDTIIAATSKGIYKANINNSTLENIDSWQLANTIVCSKIAINNNEYYLAIDTVLYKWNGSNNPQKIFGTQETITDVVTMNDTIVIGCFVNNGYLAKINNTGNMYYDIGGVSPIKMEVDNNNILWIANAYGGLKKMNGKVQTPYQIDGPFFSDAFNIKFINKSLYVCSGYIDPQYNFFSNRNGVNRLKNNIWYPYNQYTTYPQMDTIVDIIDAEEDRLTGSIYFASFGGGFVEIDKAGKMTCLSKNSIIGKNQNAFDIYLVTNLKMDADNNLWVTVSNTKNNLLCKKKDGTWKAFSLPTSGDNQTMAQIEIDNIGQKWIVLPRIRGLMVFNDNGTIDNTSDDKYKVYNASVGKGNLISNDVKCIAKDKDGKLWVGTDNGISIINCPEVALTNEGCEAENKIVQYDIAAGKLFQDQYITSIAVDGANRKWVGTINGVWLVSADAEKIIQRFTTSNSPLPSNEITKIEIDGATGMVYIATQNGIMGYRYTATDGATELLEPLVYPNPVSSNYKGTIAISGLVDNADVRIVDVAGQMVYRTKAFGGQAVWDGNTYTGYRPQSGIYYVLATNADGSVTQKTKFIFEH